VSEKPGNGSPADEPATAEGAQPEPTGLEVAPEGAAPPLTREALEALRRERDELHDQLLRRRADFENFRKRVERDRLQAEKAAATRVCEALLPILDNLDRALSAFPSDSPLREGVEMIQRQILALLQTEGVLAKDPTGERFDPETHQALCYEAIPGFEDGTVVETYRKAYFLGGRLLRPALVKVARGEGSDSSGGESVH
jgi:molecular chaperone GrpE